MPRTIALEPMRVEVVRHPNGRDDVVAYDARDLFDQANTALSGKNYDLALSLYDRMLQAFPDSALVPPALYNAGLALEGKGDTGGAIRRYLDVASRAPGTRDALDAEVRAGAVMTEAGRLHEAQALFDKVLARTNLADGDRVELLARRGYAEVEMKDYAHARSRSSPPSTWPPGPARPGVTWERTTSWPWRTTTWARSPGARHGPCRCVCPIPSSRLTSRPRPG